MPATIYLYPSIICQKVESQGLQITINTPPSLSLLHVSDHPFISQYNLLKGRKLGIIDYSLSLYTYLSLSTIYQKYNRREYRPLQNPFILNTLFYNIPNLLKPLIELPYPFINPYGFITLLYRLLYTPSYLLQNLFHLLQASPHLL